MPCFSPIPAYRLENGNVSFDHRVDGFHFSVPCGQCIGCRLERSRQWAVRCMHEAALYAPNNAFITLTYDDDHIPYRNALDYRVFQLFLKRLRKEVLPFKIRFYMCGEYGPDNGRPHYHAIIFNYGFLGDRTYWSKTPCGERIYRSAQLESLWPYGFASVGNVTFESAAYIARYCVEKVTGQFAQAHYARVDAEGAYVLPAEFNHMSTRPGIGASWLEKYRSDVYPMDHVIVNGRECKPPRYYDKLLRRMNPAMLDAVREEREYQASMRVEDNVVERLVVKAQCATARANAYKER